MTIKTESRGRWGHVLKSLGESDTVLLLVPACSFQFSAGLYAHLSYHAYKIQAIGLELAIQNPVILIHP